MHGTQGHTAYPQLADNPIPRLMRMLTVIAETPLDAGTERATGRAPALDTGGGTSDARFIEDICPVAELGLIGGTAHKADESVGVDDPEALSAIYEAVLQRYFSESPC